MCNEDEVSLYECLVNNKLLQEASYLYSLSVDELENICFKTITQCDKYDHNNGDCMRCKDNFNLTKDGKQCKPGDFMTIIIVIACVAIFIAAV